MATYYVRTNGSNANAGTGPATNQAWQTIGKVFESGSVVTGGDIVYIAPAQGLELEKLTHKLAQVSPQKRTSQYGQQ